MSEKFSLKWNDFQSNVSKTFSLLRSEEEFFDVSLVSDDQKMMSAHKLVLSASSPYFKHILTHNKHSHPLLCLDGVSSGELQFVLDYIYQGEVQIYQEQLDRFLEVAQRLKLEGLTGNDHDHESKMYETLKEAVGDVDNERFTETETFKKENVIRKPRRVSQPVVVANNSSVTNTEEIDQKISEYVIRGEDGVYSCGYCGKVGDRNVFHMRNHVETHMEGLSFSCQSCDKTFRSRESLRVHKYKSHRC